MVMDSSARMVAIAFLACMVEIALLIAVVVALT